MSYTIKGNSQGKVSDVTLVYSTGGRSHDVVVIYTSTQQGLGKGTSGTVQGKRKLCRLASRQAYV
jgi:hypothetical protein